MIFLSALQILLIKTYLFPRSVYFQSNFKYNYIEVFEFSGDYK